MPRLFTRPAVLCAFLLLITAIPILVALVRLLQIPSGTLPLESLRFAAVPLRHFTHAAAGAIFAVAGPLQFAGVLSRRFGSLHRWTGRAFGVAGLFLGLSGLGLLAEFPTVATLPLQMTRGLAGLALLAALALGIRAAIQRRIPAHRAWMIRAYVIGIGSTTISLVALPLLAFGITLEGAPFDLTFVATWIATVAVGEVVIRRTRKPALSRMPTAQTA
jgi:hypothetical protein